MALMVEQRPFRPFKSSEEYLYAMKEDLAEWLNNLYEDLNITVDNFFELLDTGVLLCRHANNVRDYAVRYVTWKKCVNVPAEAARVVNNPEVKYFSSAKRETFFARDNVSNFITWCRKVLGIIDCLLFETDDLILLKNEKNVILCLLELARQGTKYGMPAPMLVIMEREIDNEIAAENKTSSVATETERIDDLIMNGFDKGAKATPQIVTNDLKSLDDMVLVEVQLCTCPTQFPVTKVSDGKYRIGDTKVLIFVRLLRNHVMVRVGGGWDTLSHYLDKHDPCRCRNAHKSPVSSRITGLNTSGAHIEIHHAKVTYDRKQETKKETLCR